MHPPSLKKQAAYRIVGPAVNLFNIYINSNHTKIHHTYMIAVNLSIVVCGASGTSGEPSKAEISARLFEEYHVLLIHQSDGVIEYRIQWLTWRGGGGNKGQRDDRMQ